MGSTCWADDLLREKFNPHALTEITERGIHSNRIRVTNVGLIPPFSGVRFTALMVDKIKLQLNRSSKADPRLMQD